VQRRFSVLRWFQPLLVFESPGSVGTCPVNSLGKVWGKYDSVHVLLTPYERLMKSPLPHPTSYVSSILHYDRRRDIISETCCLVQRMLFFLTFSSCYNCVAKDAKKSIVYHVQLGNKYRNSKFFEKNYHWNEIQSFHLIKF